MNGEVWEGHSQRDTTWGQLWGTEPFSLVALDALECGRVSLSTHCPLFLFLNTVGLFQLPVAK